MKALRWLFASSFRLTMLLAILVFALHAWGELTSRGSETFLQRIELVSLDVKLRQTPPKRAPEDYGVAIVAIDDRSVTRIGRMPWSRSIHAQLVDRLTELGAASIAFDVLFGEPESSETRLVYQTLASGQLGDLAAVERALETARSLSRSNPTLFRELEAAERVLSSFRAAVDDHATRPGPDDELAHAMERSGRVVLAVEGLRDLEARGLDSAARAAALRSVATSTISELFVASSDGRRLDVFKSSRAAFSSTALLPRFLTVRAPIPALTRSTKHFGLLNVSPASDGVIRSVPLVSAVSEAGVALPAFAVAAVAAADEKSRPVQVIGHLPDGDPERVKVAGRSIETELQAAIHLWWYGSFGEDLPVISAADVLEGKLDPAAVEGKIIFIGATALGTGDQRVTPVSGFEPGVHIHATLAQNILDGLHFSRPRWVVFLELLVFLSVGLLGGLVMARQDALGQILTAIGLVLGWVLVDHFAFLSRGILAVRVLVIAQVFLTLLVVASWRFLVEEREKRKTKRALGQYLSPAVMKKVLEHPEEYLRLGGRRYEATVLFSDIRGFTTFSEALTPEALGALLNRYMTPMTHIVFANGGTLDKYIGDAVMAFWGAPVEQDDHAVRAARAALQMIAKVKELNVEFARDELPVIAIGIGLSSGPMTIGNMGSDTYFAYTALGDRVNLGSRLEGQTKTYGVDILVAEATYHAIKETMLCRGLDALRVKGKHEPVEIYELVAEQPGSPQQEEWVRTFANARKLYLARRFDEAGVEFEKAYALGGPKDKASHEYVELCRQYLATPPPADWDGVRVAASK
ncbi:MAG: adenylate/guanylate cyclase domain-containing protein [Deltaproteobacteria bacterium]|nr:adenylate/guanylate cyclase domain-containing protein [Deltaproteobacteria bacterium]